MGSLTSWLAGDATGRTGVRSGKGFGDADDDPRLPERAPASARGWAWPIAGRSRTTGLSRSLSFFRPNGLTIIGPAASSSFGLEPKGRAWGTATSAAIANKKQEPATTGTNHKGR